MKMFKYLSLVLVTSLLAACGGGSDGCEGGTLAGSCTPTDPTDPDAATPAIVEVIADTNTLPSDVNRLNSVRITAIVSDEAGAALEGRNVSFQATADGRLTTINGGVTNSAGVAEADLNHGVDLSNRDILVSATVVTTGSDTIGGTSPVVRVVNTRLELTGGTEVLTAGEASSYTAILTDSNGAPVPNYEVIITSAAGNTVRVDGFVVDENNSPANTVFTDSSGAVSIEVSGEILGADTLTVIAAGETRTSNFEVTNDVFQFDAPNAGAEINIGVTRNVRLRWEQGGPVVGQPIAFTTTRGTISGGNGCGGATPCNVANTNGSGVAEVQITSTDAGPATIVATDQTNGQSNSLAIEFIATTPDTLVLKTEKTRVNVGEQTNLTAQVKDPTGNPVKNALVNFNAIVDVTNGDVFPATAVTDSNGEARSVYTGGDVPSATDGVTVRAEIDGNASINDTVNLTVAGVARDVTIGTGNTIFEIGTATYGVEWVVIVKDGVGNPVPNALVEVSLISDEYLKGFYRLPDPIAEPTVNTWVQEVTAVCENEDGIVSGIIDGILDPGEDINGNGTLEPGNVAVVAAVPDDAADGSPCSFGNFAQGSQAADVAVNENGLARVCVYYPQNFANWLDVVIEARTQVSGTEFGDQNTFLLPVNAADVSDLTSAPPNFISPFGVAASCADPD